MSRRKGTVVCALVGLVGSAAVAVGGASVLNGHPVAWWIPGTLLGPVAARAVLIAGLVVLCGAWLGLGLPAGRARWGAGGAAGGGGARWGAGLPGVAPLAAVGALWALPLFLGPPLFSQDVYSYLAQGLIAHLGLDPYRQAPAALAALGHPGVLGAVDPFWRHTTAPYGPGSIGLAAAVAAVSASHLELSVLLLRLPQLTGLALMIGFAPRLARRCGGDPARAVWFAALSPLALVELVAAGHNDGLMVGLLVAGLALALEGRMAWAIAACALAASVKLPAAAAIPLIFRAEARERPGRRVRTSVQAVLVTAGALALVTLVAGLGPDWLYRGALSTQGQLRLAVSPATDVGWVLGHLLTVAGVTVNARSLELAAGKWVLLIPATLGVVLLWRVRRETLAAYAGLLLLSVALLGPEALPWYLLWGVSVLACLPGWQERRALLLLVTAPVFLIYADGRLRLPLSAAPWVLGAYAAGALGLVLALGRQARAACSSPGASRGAVTAPPGEPALTGRP